MHLLLLAWLPSYILSLLPPPTLNSVQDDIYALGKAHMRSTLPLGTFPNVAFVTVPNKVRKAEDSPKTFNQLKAGEDVVVILCQKP